MYTPHPIRPGDLDGGRVDWDLVRESATRRPLEFDPPVEPLRFDASGARARAIMAAIGVNSGLVLIWLGLRELVALALRFGWMR